MNIKWLGHASFLITSNNGTKIITDPYVVGGGLKYGEIDESADIVSVSHNHGDHNNIAAVKGNPQVVRQSAPVEIKGIKINGIDTFHDSSGGQQRGENIIFCFDIDGLRVCHLGDLGHSLDNEQIDSLGKVDILLIPVGGFYTIDAEVATDISRKLAPRVIIPMHYKNERCDFPISGIDDFLKGKPDVKMVDASEVVFKSGGLPDTTQINVLQPAL